MCKFRRRRRKEMPWVLAGRRKRSGACIERLDVGLVYQTMRKERERDRERAELWLSSLDSEGFVIE